MATNNALNNNLASGTGLPLTTGVTGVLPSANGGTGVNNGSSTITLGGNLTTSGAFASTFTMTNTTGVTFPTSGTLATTSQLPTPAALTRVDDTNVTLTLGGTPATALLQATSITAGWSGQLAVSRGGTGAATQTAYAVLCGGTTSTSAYQSVASVGTAGQVLTSNGAGALPTFQTPAAGGLNFNTQSVVTGSRATNTTYQNTSGKTMFVVVSIGNGGGGVGTSVAYTNSTNPPTGTSVAEMSHNPASLGGTSSFSFMVLNNNYYYVGSNSGPLLQWVEWTG